VHNDDFGFTVLVIGGKAAAVVCAAAAVVAAAAALLRQSQSIPAAASAVVDRGPAAVACALARCTQSACRLPSLLVQALAAVTGSFLGPLGQENTAVTPAAVAGSVLKHVGGREHGLVTVLGLAR
jgi:hypothetical protein